MAINLQFYKTVKRALSVPPIIIGRLPVLRVPFILRSPSPFLIHF